MVTQAIFGADCAVHHGGLGDTETGKGINLKAQLVRREHFLLFHLNAQDALVDHLDLFNKGYAEGKSSACFAEFFARFIGVYDPVDLTIAADNGLLRFGNDIHRHAHQYERTDRANREINRIAKKATGHCLVPVTVTDSAFGAVLF